MDAKQLALDLHRTQYGSMPENLVKVAKENRLLIITGSSDDIIDLSGIINDEVYGKIVLVPKGERLEVADEEGEWTGHFKDFTEDGFMEVDDDTPTEGGVVEGVYTDEGVWRFTTKLKHELFQVLEGDELQCVGIVIDFKDLNLKM